MSIANRCSRVLGLLAVVTTAVIPQAQAITITAQFDANWLLKAPAGATADVNYVINQYTSAFTNPGNVTIQFDWGNIAGSKLPGNALGVATFPQFLPGNAVLLANSIYTFNQTKNFLTQASIAQPRNTALATAVANLPAAYPCPGCGTPNFFIPDTEYLALTGNKQNNDVINAYIGMGTKPGNGWDFSAGKPSGGRFDFTAVLEHEIAHALGRVDYAFSSGKAGGAPPFLTPLSFYKYKPGTNQLNPNFNVTNFSLDKGAHALEMFNATSDSSDWLNTRLNPQDSYDAALSPNTFALASPQDFTMMKALGYNPTAGLGGRLTGSTIAPNWAFGSPQTPSIRLCTTVGGRACSGAFGLGPLDSVFDFSLIGRQTTTEASFAALERLRALGLLESGNDGIGDWWNLTIPNAVWLGSAAYNLFTTNQPPGTVSDAIAFVNIGGLAHILWANGVDPINFNLLPPDYLNEIASLGLTPTDVFSSNGFFDNQLVQLPKIEECDGNFDSAICNQDLPGQLPGQIPEPLTLGLFCAGLLGLGALRRR